MPFPVTCRQILHHSVLILLTQHYCGIRVGVTSSLSPPDLFPVPAVYSGALSPESRAGGGVDPLYPSLLCPRYPPSPGRGGVVPLYPSLLCPSRAGVSAEQAVGGDGWRLWIIDQTGHTSISTPPRHHHCGQPR